MSPICFGFQPTESVMKRTTCRSAAVKSIVYLGGLLPVALVGGRYRSITRPVAGVNVWAAR